MTKLKDSHYNLVFLKMNYARNLLVTRLETFKVNYKHKQRHCSSFKPSPACFTTQVMVQCYYNRFYHLPRTNDPKSNTQCLTEYSISVKLLPPPPGRTNLPLPTSFSYFSFYNFTADSVIVLRSVISPGNKFVGLENSTVIHIIRDHTRKICL